MRQKSSEKLTQHSLVKSAQSSKIVLGKSASQDNASEKPYNELKGTSGPKITFINTDSKAANYMKKTVNNILEKNNSDPVITVVKGSMQKRINCRLCDKDITGKECRLLYDHEENVETRLGRKINIIINSSETQLNLSQYCCSACTSKIEICFSLLVEIQASDEVIKQTYGHSSDGAPIDTSSQLFICGECKSTVTGIKTFIRHYENHILKKTVINSKRDLKVSVPPAPEDWKGPSDAEKTIRGSNSKRASPPRTEDVTDGFECNDNVKQFRRVDSKHCKVQKGRYKKASDADASHLPSDELHNGDGGVQQLGDSGGAASDNEFTASLDSDPSEEGECAESAEKGEGLGTESDSDASTSSESSYNNLVGIVKRELEKSDSDEDAAVEITVNGDGEYYCGQCNQTFEYKFLLAHHLMSDHRWKGFAEDSGSDTNKLELDEDGLVHCPRCQELYLPSKIEKHLQVCSEEYIGSGDVLCHACGKLCSHKQWLTHKKKHSSHAGTWGCELCGKRFKAKRILRSHLGEHDESKKKVCEICGKKLLPLSFFSHMMKHKEKRHVCQFCGKGFTYNYGLRMHLKVHEGSERLVPKPGKKRDKIFCWLCKKDFESSSALHKHLKNEHNIEGVKQDSRFSCSECDKKFADMFGLKAHLKLIHEMKDEEISRFKSLPVYRYIECNVCNQVFNSENKVRIHMKQDHGLKPFEMEILKKECEKCGKRFASKQNLIHHINGAHLNIKPMQCDICNERFAKHSSLIYHKLRHSGEKPFQCEYCQKTYRQRNDVIRHLARHVRDQELTLEEASAINNSSSPLVLKRRIFLKDSSISYRTLVSRNRRQRAEIVEVDPTPIVETKVEYDEGSLIYVEEVMADEIQQPESPNEVKYMTVKPVYNEERNTIILSSPELFKNAVENVSYRYVTPHAKDVPAVIVKKETEM